MSREEFFEGYSIPRNKELMRIYKDLEMVEQLGSGIPRILGQYGKDSFYFSENFLRLVFLVTPPSHPMQVKKLLRIMVAELYKILGKLNLSDREYFRLNYLQPALKAKEVVMTIPDKPTNSKQRYRIAELGEKVLENS